MSPSLVICAPREESSHPGRQSCVGAFTARSGRGKAHARGRHRHRSLGLLRLRLLLLIRGNQHPIRRFPPQGRFSGPGRSRLRTLLPGFPIDASPGPAHRRGVRCPSSGSPHQQRENTSHPPLRFYFASYFEVPHAKERDVRVCAGDLTVGFRSSENGNEKRVQRRKVLCFGETFAQLATYTFPKEKNFAGRVAFNETKVSLSW
ncbi:hypothetical protein HPB48_007449 [Haemaphysalis longicornis]|uniref:Uncharacterized protein n=1 Tax=Haemaphysalis longicornis TaxID=44386 RepID=A0A9J6GEH0_HAELO|nr:hypothetical protein HPB48_007449 [Haemaphysalis longicornis]